MIEIIYPNNDGPERPKENVVDEMNSILAENTRNGETMPTVQKIAESLGLQPHEYHDLVRNNEGFIKGIRDYLGFHNTGLPSAYQNRLDATMVAVCIMEHHKLEGKEE